MECTTYIEHDLLKLKVQYKASLFWSTPHPFIIYYLILVAHSQSDSFMGLFIVWKAFGSYQVKKTKQPNKKPNKNDVNVPKCHFAQANEITAIGFVALTNHIMALGSHFVQVQIYCYQRSVTTFLTCHNYSISDSTQEKVSLNSNT